MPDYLLLSQLGWLRALHGCWAVIEIDCSDVYVYWNGKDWLRKC